MTVLPHDQQRKQDTYAYLVIVLFLLLASALIGREVYVRLILPAAPLNFDEAAHSLPAHYLLRDVRNLDWPAFRGDFHIQMLWPPMFSLMQMPLLALLGNSDETARLFAYLTLVLGVLMGGAVARRIAPSLAPIAMLASGLLALSAPGWLFVGSWANQETPVAFVVFIVFWLFLKALETRKPLWFAATSLGLYALFLTKYNYAAFGLASVVLVGAIDLIERIREGRRLKAEGKPVFNALSPLNFVLLYAPFAIGLLYWFFGASDIEMARPEEKWKHFRFFVTNEDTGYSFWSEQNLLFYVRAATNWLMPHPVLFIASLIGAVYAVVRVHHPGVRLLAVFFGLGFVLATIHQLKAERYITPLFPSLWLLAGIGLAAFIQRLMQDAKRHRALLRPASCALVLLVALGSWLYWLPRLQPVWMGDVANSARAAAQQIVDWQIGDKPVLIIGTFGELSPPLFEWRLRPLPVFAKHGNIQYDAPPGEGSDLDRVQRWAAQNPDTQITLIKIAPDSPLFNTDDMQKKNLWRQKLVSEFEAEHKRLGYRLVDAKSYSAGISISFYLPQ
jgi:hypothetical protein